MKTERYTQLDRDNLGVTLKECPTIRICLFNDIATQYKRKTKLILKLLEIAPREQLLKIKVQSPQGMSTYGEYGNIVINKEKIEDELRLIDDNLKDMLLDYAFLSMFTPDLPTIEIPKEPLTVIDGAINNFFTAPDWDFRYND